MIKKFIHIFLNFLFPQQCLGCGKKNEILCQECLKRIDYPTLLKYNNIFAASDYNDEIVKKAIWMLKYRGIKQIAEPLTELIKQRIGDKIKIQDNLIIPIPLSKKRFKERGFNQAELIAKYLTSDADGKNIGCLTNVLYKIKETSSQVSIKNREERLNNLRGSFGVKNPELIKNKNIILIDDVSTTGATIREARKVLREAGAQKIIATVVARG
jgi:competence protein ComFC